MPTDPPSPQPASSRLAGLLLSIGLVLLVTIAFAPVFTADFINFDDPFYVIDNPHVRTGLTRDNLAWAFTTFHASNWHPLTWVSLMLDAEVAAELAASPYVKPATVYHAGNLALHAINALMLFQLLRRWIGSAPLAAFAAAAFAVHPLRVESVAWVSERKDVLSACLGLLCLHAYFSYAKRPGVARYLLVALLLGLSLLAKPMLVTMPFLLLLLDLWPLQRVKWKASAPVSPASAAIKPALKWVIAEKLPLLTMALASCAVTYLAQRAGGAVRTIEDVSPAQRLMNVPVAYVGYLLKTLWPTELAVIYPLANRSPAMAAGATALLVILTAAALARARTRPMVALGWLWFLGTLVPVIGLVQVGGQSMADRYTYFPGIGLLLVFLGLWPAPRADALARTAPRPIAALAAAGVVAALTFATFQQTRLWRDSITLFQHAVEVTRGNWLAHRNLGVAWYDAGRPDLAIEHYRAALAINEGTPLLHNNLGVALVRTGELNNAARSFRRALQLRPRYAEASLNLGVALSLAGNAREAVEVLEPALREQPAQPQALYHYARSLSAVGRVDDAIAAFERALAAQPRQPETHNSFGITLAKAGRFREACVQFRAAVDLKHDYADARANLERALAMLERPPAPATQPN